MASNSGLQAVVSSPTDYQPINSGETLRNRLIFAQKSSQFDSAQLYVPAADVYEIISNVSITELKGLELDDPAEVKTWVVGRERIFATLLYSRLARKIQTLIRLPDIDDSFLPVDYNFEDKLMNSETRNEKRRIMKTWSQLFAKWHECEKIEFCDNQWRFNAITFQMRAYKYDQAVSRSFSLRNIFPFSIEGPSKGTPFNKVWKILIDPGNIGEWFRKPEAKWVPSDTAIEDNKPLALKEAAIQIDGIRVKISLQESSNELSIHQKLFKIKGGDIHDNHFNYYEHHLNLIRGTFQRGNSLFILLPWAEKGNLLELWDSVDIRNHPSEAVLKWIQTNVTGLIGGLCLLHRFNCTHGDLKPDNILVTDWNAQNEFQWLEMEPKTREVVEDLGILQIADFGVSRIHEHATATRKQDINPLVGARRYAPPECDMRAVKMDDKRSRLYDVWSIGCIFFELIVWLCYSKRGLQQFNKNIGSQYVGKFWEVVGDDKPCVNKEVERQIRILEDELHRGDDQWLDGEMRVYLLHLLKTIKTQMLVTAIAIDGKKDQGNYRAYSAIIFDKMINYSCGDLNPTAKFEHKIRRSLIRGIKIKK